jgi:putative ATP-binding cassette transporter
MWSRLVTLAIPFFRSDVRRRAIGGLTLAIILLIAINGTNVVNSYIGRDFMSALAERHGGRFYFYAAVLAGVFAVATAVEVLSVYVQQRVAILWREWLTRRFIARYIAGRAYLRLAKRQDIDNPDERISQDVSTFTSTTLSILVLLVSGALTLVAFSGVLWLITPWLFVTALAYAAVGSAGTILLGRRLIPLNNEQLRREADFRYTLGRLREHAEAVAEVGGEAEQERRLESRLTRLVANFRKIIRISRNLGFFTTEYGYLPQIIPAAVAAPLYLRRQVDFGAITQAAMAFAQVQGAFSIIVTQFQTLTSYAVVVGRLGALWEATEPSAASPSAAAAPIPLAKPPAPAHLPAGPVVETSPDAPRVLYEHVNLWTPEVRRPLIRDLSLELHTGRRIAITGPHDAEGALLFATAGLWPDGEGRISRPARRAVMFIGQRPCAVAGRLREILLDGLGREIADDRLQTLLAEVDLTDVVARAGGLDADCDWSQRLSAGQLQALRFVRLLLASPRFAFLGDPCLALDAPAADRLYPALARSSITYVSVGCPEALFGYHDAVLEVHADGTWHLHEPPCMGADRS